MIGEEGDQQLDLWKPVSLVSLVAPLDGWHPVLRWKEWMAEALPLVEPEEQHGPQHPEGEERERTHRIAIRGLASSLEDRVEQESCGRNHAAVIEQYAKARRQAGHDG